MSNLKISIFCSSMPNENKNYMDLAYRVGQRIAETNNKLVWGGTKNGMMGAVYRGSHENDGYEIGIIPELLNDGDIRAEEGVDEMLVTENFSDRKDLLMASDAFIILPGGFGTLEEISQALVEKQLKITNKPIVFLDIDGFWDPLIKVFNRFFEKGTANPKFSMMYKVINNVEDTLDYINNYKIEDNIVPEKLYKG